ncbi:MAG: hypothetical protein HZY79_06665 [Rhodoblastus sp.]|nr:MAG: hypothetical protein HZY79_06665 [Rhodoblastus sp.]
MDRHLALAVLQRGGDVTVNLLNAFIGHREAADRHAIAMHHDRRAGASVLAVEGVGIADVEGEMVLRLRIGWRAVTE